MAQRREFEYTEMDFRFIARLLYQKAGITLPPAKQDMVYSRLSKRLRALGLTRFRDYTRYLKEHESEELEPFLNALTTNLTSFFREAHHFEFLRRELLPKLAGRSTGQPIRIWSAGCSSGQEPYTIAMVLRDNLPAGRNARILATDLDSQVLAQAQAGIYPLEAVEGMEPALLRRHFLRGRGRQQGQVRVKPHVREMVIFRRLNLLEPWPMKTRFDAIFCRNVFIYFDKPTQTRLATRFADCLAPNGHLFLGHSEILQGLDDRFIPLGRTIYRRAA